MSDWRPDRDPSHEGPRFEIPLAGDLADQAGRSSQDAPPAPNWRKVAGLSALAGVTLGIVVAVVLLASGGDDDPPGADRSGTTVDPDELAAALTVPPTLTPATEPSVTLPPPPGATGDGELDDPALVAASVETLPPQLGGDLDPPDGFRLSDGSLAALDVPTARRSVTEHLVGVDGFEQTVTITNDPATERYLLEFDTGSAVQHVIVDLPGELSYVEIRPDEWTTVSNAEIAANSGSPDMATFLRSLQLGPIRSDTSDSWVLVQANDLVETNGDEPLREWVVVLGAAAVPEWARYAFGPTGDAPPLPGNTLVGYAVYVAADGSIRVVNGATEYGATTQRTVHRIEELDEPPTIELPIEPPVTEEPATEEPATEAPVTEPSTSAPPG